MDGESRSEADRVRTSNRSLGVAGEPGVPVLLRKAIVALDDGENREGDEDVAPILLSRITSAVEGRMKRAAEGEMRSGLESKV